MTLLTRSQMRGQRNDVLEWPYVEGLRMDEAMHPLTILAVGVYGEVLPNQNGAPMRLVVPWKYGFKGAKSIARIRFVEKQPLTSWMKQLARGVWVLFERESEGGSPAAQPGHRSAAALVLPVHADADVQRLWRSGGEPLQRDGSGQELLKAEGGLR